MHAAIQLPQRPWAPLTDREFQAISAWLPAGKPGRRGRRPENLRRTLDAVFWVACSSGPWRDLPAELGKPDSANRALRRWAKEGVLDRLLAAIAPRAQCQGAQGQGAQGQEAQGQCCPVLAGLAFWIARAFRRMARVVGLASIARAKRLGLVDAWPSPTLWLPTRAEWRRARGLVRAGELDLSGLAPALMRTAARMVLMARRYLDRMRNFRRGWTTR